MNSAIRSWIRDTKTQFRNDLRQQFFGRKALRVCTNKNEKVVRVIHGRGNISISYALNSKPCRRSLATGRCFKFRTPMVTMPDQPSTVAAGGTCGVGCPFSSRNHHTLRPPFLSLLVLLIPHELSLALPLLPIPCIKKKSSPKCSPLSFPSPSFPPSPSVAP
jgi:hypothetical protein